METPFSTIPSMTSTPLPFDEEEGGLRDCSATLVGLEHEGSAQNSAELRQLDGEVGMRHCIFSASNIDVGLGWMPMLEREGAVVAGMPQGDSRRRRKSNGGIDDLQARHPRRRAI